jgi:hypothetical protein
MSASPNEVARLMCPRHTACEKWTLTHTAVQSPVRTLVRKTSWYDAIQVIKAAGGKLAVTIPRTATREAGFRQGDHT